MELQSRKRMKEELESLRKQAEEKAGKVKQRRESLEELPKVIREIEAHLRKGYSLFFDEPLLSKKDMSVMEGAPRKLQVAMHKFYHQSLRRDQSEPQISININGTSL